MQRGGIQSFAGVTTLVFKTTIHGTKTFKTGLSKLFVSF